MPPPPESSTGSDKNKSLLSGRSQRSPFVEREVKADRAVEEAFFQENIAIYGTTPFVFFNKPKK